MTEPPTLDTLTEQEIADRSEAAGEPAWLRDRRLEGYKRWADLEWPKLRGEELWRDTPFTRFRVDVPLATADGGVPAVRSPLIDSLDGLAGRAILADGHVELAGSVVAESAGVIITDLASAAREHEELVREHLGRLTADHDRTVAASDAAWTAGLFVYIPPEVELSAPIGISVAVGHPGAHLPRVLLVVDRHARAEALIEHVSAPLDSPATVDEVVEVVVGDGARVDLVTVQDWKSKVGHLSLQAAELQRDAHLTHVTVTIGGDTVRLRPEVHLVGPGAKIEPLGVYFADDGQHFEHHPFIEHAAGHAVSDVLYKGALQGRSRTVFRGHIYVHKDAVGSDSNETNKSLILSDGAKADSTPFLEIECSDVRAGHGSATGQVDQNQLFYLESRGITPEDALRLVVFGFFAEVLDRIELPAVRDRTSQHIAAEVERADLAALSSRGRPLGRGE